MRLQLKMRLQLQRQLEAQTQQHSSWKAWMAAAAEVRQPRRAGSKRRSSIVLYS
jgi:hypothetical protein